MNTVVYFFMVKKKSEVDVGKGFKRIYFVIAGLWIAVVLWWFINGWFNFKDLLWGVGTPIAIYFFLLFIIKGFKK